ncbi:MAG: hypothetical protein ABIG30_00920 [Candidatus Aenigmatarchaeota archaeon]
MIKTIFIGRYEVGVDGKGRLKLPGDFLATLGNDAFSLDWPESYGSPYVALHPAGRSSEYVLVPDTSGRIVLPEHALQHAGISDKAVLLGMTKWVELWEPELFQAQIDVGRQEFAKYRMRVLV